MRLGMLAIGVAAMTLLAVAGCVGRTGKVGTPAAEIYKEELATLKVGQSTPEDLKQAFGERRVSLKKTAAEGGKQVEVWEVFKGGKVDAAQFLLWGQIAHDKDQSILFRFEEGRLASYESVIHPDK